MSKITNCSLTIYYLVLLLITLWYHYFDSLWCKICSSTFYPGHVSTTATSNKPQIDYEVNGEVNVFYRVYFLISYMAWCKNNLAVASHISNLTWCSQGLREAIKNGDVAAVKKLLNEVCFFQMMHLL